MWESDNCVTFDDRPPCPSMPPYLRPVTMTRDNHNIQSYIITPSGQAPPLAADFYRARNSPTPLKHLVLSVSPLHQQTVCVLVCVLCVCKMIYCKFWVQTMQLFSPGTCACAGAWSLVPAEDWLLPSPKIKTVKRDAVCSEPGFLVTRRELIIWIRKRDPRTLTELSLSAITTIFAGFSSEPLPSPMSMSRWIKD